MENGDRLVHCRNCESVEFRAVSKSGQVSYYCAGCNSPAGEVAYGHYETIQTSCPACGCETFKVLITEDCDNAYWAPYCSKCGNAPVQIFEDDACKIMDKAERESLILGEKIKSLMKSLEHIKLQIETIDDKINQDSISNLEQNSVWSLIGEIENCEDGISKLEWRIKGINKEQ